MSRPQGRILDTGRIQQLARIGFTNAQIAEMLHVPVNSIIYSRRDRSWEEDPTLRARWEARLPRIKAALKAEIEEQGK